MLNCINFEIILWGDWVRGFLGFFVALSVILWILRFWFEGFYMVDCIKVWVYVMIMVILWVVLRVRDLVVIGDIIGVVF